MPTPTLLEQITAQRDALARCVIFTVNHGDFKGGCVMRTMPDGEIKMEGWLPWFRRELAAMGVSWDDDLLAYGRASQTNKKKMLKENPELKAKLDKLAEERKAGK